jgi:hypothetical protein
MILLLRQTAEGPRWCAAHVCSGASARARTPLEGVAVHLSGRREEAMTG